MVDIFRIGDDRRRATLRSFCHTDWNVRTWRAIRRTAFAVVVLAAPAPALATEGITMWGCAQGGERRNILYLADRGSQSYVKLGTQRIPADLTVTDAEQRWTFGANHISLDPDGIASYVEGGAVKARFRCRKMASG